MSKFPQTSTATRAAIYTKVYISENTLPAAAEAFTRFRFFHFEGFVTTV
jgi:hypothetical protein